MFDLGKDPEKFMSALRGITITPDDVPAFIKVCKIAVLSADFHKMFDEHPDARDFAKKVVDSEKAIMEHIK